MRTECHTQSDKSSDLGPFEGAAVGVNAEVLSRIHAEWLEKANPDRALAARDHGIQHWPVVAASQGGVLKLTLRRETEGEGRCYALAPFPIQAMPRDLRPAFTPTVDGHRVIVADWKASHWQLLGWRAQDGRLVEALRSGDLYTAAFPGVERRAAKIGLNAMLNGAGLTKIATSAFGGDVEAAKAFKAEAEGKMTGEWKAAGAWIRNAKAEAVAQGWTHKEYGGAGITLMRVETDALMRAVDCQELRDLGMLVMVPLHDGIVVSAPAVNAQAVADLLAFRMVEASTGSRAEAADHRDQWVSVKVSASWDGDAPTVVGEKLRAAGYAAIVRKTSDPHALTVAAGAMHVDLAAAGKAHHQTSDAGKAVKAALAQRQAGLAWLAASNQRHGDAAKVTRVQLPHTEASYTNLCRVLAGDSSLPALRYNVRENAVTIGGEIASDTLMRRSYLPTLENSYGIRIVPDGTLNGAAFDVAINDSFDPILDWFESLPPWDGEPRASMWLSDFAGVENTALTRAYAYKWLVSIIARAYDPGCKVDTLLVLLGGQGLGKSKMLRAIAPLGSYADIAIDPHDKDSVLRAARYAVIEWGEMSGLGKREQGALKAYFARQEDEVRPPYARTDVKIPRRVVFAATTNLDDFLSDETGARRFWSVTVGDKIDLAGLEAAKEQLWAEALFMYRWMVNTPRDLVAEDQIDEYDYKWWLSPRLEADKEEDDVNYSVEDPYSRKVMEYARRNGGDIQLDDLLTHLEVSVSDWGKMQKALSSTLRRLKFTRESTRIDGKQARCWRAPAGTVATYSPADPIPFRRNG